MTLLSTHEASRVRNLALSALHHIAAEQHCEVPDIIALITPSQPGDASRSHAPAADTPDLPAGVMTDGGGLSSSLGSNPSVTPYNEAHVADLLRRFPVVNSALREREQAEEPQFQSDGPNPFPVASVVPDDARPAEAKTSAEDALSSASGGVQGGLPAHPATPSPETATTGEDRESASATGESPVTPSAGVSDAQPHGDENEVATISQTTDTIDDAANEGGQRADAGVLGSAVESGAPPPKRAPSPSERFYIRDALGRYVHHGLEPSPDGAGPLMTANRVYAWFGNRKQFTGAAKRWPELNGMRRIRPQS